MKKFTALHISGLYLRRLHQLEDQTVLHALYRDIADYRSGGGQIDAVFFSGELIAKGLGSTAGNIYGQFIRPILHAASLPGSRFHIVPGSREADARAADAFGEVGFSLLSTREQLKQVIDYIDTVLHGYKDIGDASSLAQSLAQLFAANAGYLYPSRAALQGYAVFEFDSLPAPHWTISLREYEEQAAAFRMSASHVENDGGQAALAADGGALSLALPSQSYWDALERKADARMLAHAVSACAPRAFDQLFVEPPLAHLPEQPFQPGASRGGAKYVPLDTLTLNDRAIFFIGGGESGKSAILNFLCLQANNPDYFWKETHAFYIDLKYCEGNSRAVLLAAASDFCDGIYGPADIAGLLKQGRALLCFDNLDAGNGLALKVIAAFVAEFSSCKFFFAADAGCEKQLNETFWSRLVLKPEVAYLHSFGREQIRQLVKNWFPADADEVRQRLDAVLRSIRFADFVKTPLLVSILIWINEQGRPFSAVNQAGIVDAFVSALLELPDRAADARTTRRFLIEFAYFLFEARAKSVSAVEFDGFAVDYFEARGQALAAIPVLGWLFQKGLLCNAGASVAFSFDSFRAFFLAQRFELADDFMKYAFTHEGFAELRAELDFYTGLHWDKVEILTAADRMLEVPLSGPPALAAREAPDRYEDSGSGASLAKN